MTAPSPDTIRRNLRDAGYVPVRAGKDSGWVPAAYAERVRQQIEAHRETVQCIADKPAGPRGRKKRS